MIPAKFSVLVVVVYKADATVFELPIDQFDELFHAIGVFIGRVDELFDDACNVYRRCYPLGLECHVF